MVTIKPGVKVEKGDRVKLKDEFRRYPSRMNNPTIESKHECFGTIEKIYQSSSFKVHIKRQFVVIWDNGTSNGYSENDLVKESSEYGDINSIW